MRARAIKTDKISPKSHTLQQVLDAAIPALPEKSVVAVSSKIVALAEGRVAPDGSNKEDLVHQEADLYLPASESAYGFNLTITHNTLVASAGIDESNTGGHHVLWPADSQASANEIREYLVEKFGLKEVGVIITDSVCTPLRWGTSGISLAHSGFVALRNYIGEADLFDRPMRVTRANIAGGLAATAVLVMGEGSEQTPIAVLEGLDFVEFQPRNPSAEELKAMQISIEEDLYAPLLTNAPWQKGKGD